MNRHLSVTIETASFIYVLPLLALQCFPMLLLGFDVS